MATLRPIFTVNVLDEDDGLIGPGPLANVISVTVEEAIDMAGRISIVLPSHDPRANYLVSNERRVEIETADGIVAHGIMKQVLHDLQPHTTTVTGPDRLGELVHLSTQYSREYDNIATATIIGTDASGSGLLRDTGWSQGTVSPSITPTTITFDSQTILAALITLAKQTGDHFREGSTERTLDYSTLGAISGIRFANVAFVAAEQAEPNDHLVYINQLQVATITEDIENRIYPLGASQFTLEDATSACTDIKVIASRGPLGQTTALVGAHSATATLTVTAGTGSNFTVGETVWIGTSSDWTQTHETGVVQSTTANTIVLTGAISGSYSGGEAVIQRYQFYVEDTTSKTTYGLRENTPQFSWIKPIDDTVLADRQQAADVLYYAAKARLLRYSSSYQSVILPEVLNLPSTLRVGDRVMLDVTITDTDGEFVLQINQLFYVLKIVRTWSGTGQVVASLEVADVSRPTPNNVNFVLYNLDTLSWQGIK